MTAPAEPRDPRTVRPPAVESPPPPGADWPSRILSEPDEVLRMTMRLCRTDPLNPMFLFRGQADYDWALGSSLTRILAIHGISSPEQALDVERELFEYFASQMHLHTQIRLERSPWMTWPVMQHHGAPTRLLDWTASLYVALYFACERRFDRDGAVWMFSRGALLQQLQWEAAGEHKTVAELFEGWNSPDAPNQVFLSDAPAQTIRTTMQQSDFTINKQVLGDDATAIAGTLEAFRAREPGAVAPDTLLYAKFVIPAESKLWMLRMLHNMNISAVTLFPGIDGLGRATRELATLRSIFLAPPKRVPWEPGERR